MGVTIYTKELAIDICTKLAHGMPLTKICRNESMPNISTIYLWLTQEDKTEFLEMYIRAREDQADTMADEIIEIADDGTNDSMMIKGNKVEDKEWTNRSKLRVDARKWVASKLKPKKYSDHLKLDQNISGNITFDVKFNDEPKDKI